MSIPFLLLLFLSSFTSPVTVYGDSCVAVVHTLNAKLSQKIDEQELVDIMDSLNSTMNRKLPAKFITKHDARLRGWRPSSDLWLADHLRGHSIGGDRFRNLEHKLRHKKWREADLDYRGGHRGSKRLIYSSDGERFITVDHYKTFTEVPACR
ncbi:MAG TPA: ribonuclease domain-containing protein [Nitrospirota bacterium]|nr:ribonuclease domain-containing protein [Nitrospirota bacterium]